MTSLYLQQTSTLTRLKLPHQFGGGFEDYKGGRRREGIFVFLKYLSLDDQNITKLKIGRIVKKDLIARRFKK